MKMNWKKFDIKKFDLKKSLSAKIIIGVVLVILLLVVLTHPFGGKKGEETPAGSGETESGGEVIPITDEVLPSKGLDNTLQKDAVEEVNKLIKSFYEAKLNCDADTISQLVYPIDGYSKEELEYEVNGIEGVDDFRRVEDYQNITCYTKPGLLNDTYIVWVYYEMKFANAQTPLPALDNMYICTDESGVYIYNGTIEGEISGYIDELSESEDVRELVSSVNEEFEAAITADEGLQAIIRQLQEMSSAADEPQETSTEETTVEQ